MEKKSFLKNIVLAVGVGLSAHSIGQTPVPPIENKIDKKEISNYVSLQSDKDLLIKELNNKTYVDNPKDTKQQELFYLVRNEIKQEQDRVALMEAINNLGIEKNNLKGELERLYELHEGNINTQKAIKDLLKNLEEEVHSFVMDKLKEQKIDFNDEDLAQRAKIKLADMLVNGGGPIGDMVINLGLLINQQVGNYTGQFSDDMQKRNMLSDLISKLAKAEYEVYLRQTRYDNSTNLVKISKEKIANLYQLPDSFKKSKNSEPSS